MAYTNIDDPSAYFQAATWTGNGGSDRAIVNDGNSAMQPDWVWYKSRSNATSNILYDSSRGADYYLKSNTTGAEGSDAQMFESFDSDGFSLNGDTDGNGSGRTYVAWQWKANGGTTASNSDGSVTSTVQANQDAGFSIALATAPSSNGHWSFGHGLGVKPDMVITRQRTGGGWWTWHKDLTNQTTYYLGLNTTAAQTNEASMWGGGMTSSVIGVSSPNSTLASEPYLAYCFASKQGYSKFGKYVGNGSADGTFVYTGFKPAFVMTKRTDSTSGWFIQDIKRGIRNSSSGTALEANTNLAESGIGATNYDIDFLSNGFKLRQSNAYLNASGGSYIYMAFAENPFTTSTGIPTTAR